MNYFIRINNVEEIRADNLNQLIDLFLTLANSGYRVNVITIGNDNVAYCIGVAKWLSMTDEEKWNFLSEIKNQLKGKGR